MESGAVVQFSDLFNTNKLFSIEQTLSGAVVQFSDLFNTNKLFSIEQTLNNHGI